ncbi:MAG: P-type conjugative transfer protein VirB9 [Rickettsiales bacterium]|nr:P-type conjugative transfer protein VirB9 [Pseudomonadota bacterium]MDA0967118.1 P-type conjugative transfer protein VirB9 [Pseudomonadota bacterium]MDG4542396.1 P-type conjugative transfer protein VirB9 [Rickettsiales bacterium]MDG4544900.1 P-type conjugative transfer protein VirB9 [Rickettsiales bacterium]MDG4547023.1 P-type conjugative transfer protein VirB9 [Rickettsiales bacterium]
MKNNIYKFLIIVCAVFYSDSVAYGKTPITTDSRIKTFVYNENEVFHVTVQYGYQSNIEFAKNEEIETISIGNNYSWKITPVDRRLFIKAIEGDAQTNMTVITNKRTYQFELQSKYPDDNLDEDLVYVVRFFYPLEDLDKPKVEIVDMNMDIGKYTPETVEVYQPVVKKEEYNFNYTLTGPEDFAPVKVFDDGQSTYLQFRNNNAVVPKLFTVSNDGKEERATYSREGDYIVVKQLIDRLALRMNDDVVYIYNEG